MIHQGPQSCFGLFSVEFVSPTLGSLDFWGSNLMWKLLGFLLFRTGIWIPDWGTVGLQWPKWHSSSGKTAYVKYWSWRCIGSPLSAIRLQHPARAVLFWWPDDCHKTLSSSTFAKYRLTWHFQRKREMFQSAAMAQLSSHISTTI